MLLMLNVKNVCVGREGFVCRVVCVRRRVRLRELGVIVKGWIAVKLRSVCVLLINWSVSLESVGNALLGKIIIKEIVVEMIRF